MNKINQLTCIHTYVHTFMHKHMRSQGKQRPQQERSRTGSSSVSYRQSTRGLCSLCSQLGCCCGHVCVPVTVHDNRLVMQHARSHMQ